MYKKKLMSKIIPTLVAGSILISTGTLACAQSSTKALEQSQRQYTKKYSQDPVDNCKNRLDKLVNSSTITQEQENKILDYMEQKDNEKKEELDKIKHMTEEERKTYFANNPRKKSDLLSDLVRSGIITQEQADAIKKAMSTKQEKNQEKTKDGNIERGNTTT